MSRDDVLLDSQELTEWHSPYSRGLGIRPEGTVTAESLLPHILTISGWRLKPVLLQAAILTRLPYGCALDPVRLVRVFVYLYPCV